MQKENKMGTMPIPKLLITISLPMMISMLVQSLYNIVDSMFVARLSEEALTAVSLAFPLQMLLIAVGSGTAAGVNAVLSRVLGQKDFDKANKIVGNAVFLTILNCIVFIIIGFCFIKPFYHSQTDNADIASMGIEYLSICCILSCGVLFQIMFERFLQSTGQTLFSMISQMTGAIINIILDPILIFGLFGFPRLDIVGAALATVIGQIIGAIVAITFNHLKNKEITFKMKNMRPESSIIGHIYQVGVPAMVMQAIGSVMTYGMNLILIQFSSTATAVFGVYFKLQSFIFMPVFGLTNGMISIAAYNYGAKRKDRFMDTIKGALIITTIIMVIGTTIFLTIPQYLLKLFDASETMLEIGIPVVIIISIGFALAGICIILTSAFQALGNGFYSMIISIARQLIVILPIAYLLGKIGGLKKVWWAFQIPK